MHDASQIELRHFRHFVALAEELHFARAAARVGIAQPPFSQSIARLEALVGARLFERSRKGPTRVRLSDAGTALLETARYVLLEAAAAVERAQAAARGEVGRLRVAFVASLANGDLPRVMTEFRIAHPGVTVSLAEMTTESMLKALMVREIDLGLGREIAEQPLLAREHLFEEALHLAVGRTNEIMGRRCLRGPELAELNFIFPPAEAGARFRRHLIALCAQAGFAPRIEFEATEWSTILGFVAAGMGASIVPSSALNHRRDIRVLALQGVPEWKTAVSACWRADHASALRERLLTALRETWAQA